MLGLYMMALGILYPIGALAQGWIANAVGIRGVTVGGAVILFVVVIVAFRRPLLSGRDPRLPGDSAPAPADPVSSVGAAGSVGAP